MIFAGVVAGGISKFVQRMEIWDVASGCWNAEQINNESSGEQKRKHCRVVRLLKKVSYSPPITAL
jgi:hypothetical protein